MSIAAQGVEDQDGIGAVLIERSPRLISLGARRQRASALKRERVVADVEKSSLRVHVLNQ
jgi:hypothetical protein